MITAAEDGHGGTQYQLPANAITIDNRQPGIAQGDLYQSDESADTQAKNHKTGRPAGHPRSGMDQAWQKIEKYSSRQSAESSANQSVSNLGWGFFIQPFNDTNAQSHNHPANHARHAEIGKQQVA